MKSKSNLLSIVLVAFMTLFMTFPSVSNAQTYDVFIWTTENGLPLGDVTVVLDGETIITTGGPMGGEAIFVGKAPGVYPYTASKPGYVTVNGSVTVVDANASDFAVMVPALYDIFIWTTENGLPVGDVTVVLDGETIVTTSGPMGGEAIFVGKAPGTYTYTASKPGYITVNGSVTVVDANASDFAVMVPALYDIFIWTTDGMLPMGDVTVVLDGETIVTTGGPMGGEAIFVGKAPGTYTYTASKPGYITVNGSVTVVDANASDFAVMVPALYDIFIWTTDGMLPMGDVTVVLDGETIVTTGGPMGGEAIFVGKAPGTYTYTASKPGYITVNGSVTVVDANASDFAVMVPALYDIFIWTTDGMLPMDDVTVVLDGETIVTTSGPMGGEAIFVGKAPGTYPYTASKPGFVTVNGSVTVVDANASDFAVMVPALYDIFIWTTDQNMLAMGDVTVLLDGETIITTGGPMGGEAIFVGKAPGTYPYTASKPGYITVNGSVTVVDANASDFAVMVPAIFDITFNCSETGVSGGLEGVEITMDGITVTSDPNGIALFEDYVPGTYDYIAVKMGYITEIGTVTITDSDVTEFIEMSLGYYDMLIWCYEEGVSGGLQGVEVTIDGETVISDNTGLAWFDDYQSGTYYYTASKDGYITETGSVTVLNTTVSQDVILTLNAFDMFFWCSEEGSPMGLSNVDVTIDGVTVTSDFDGLAILENYAPGTYDYSASKDGYNSQTGTVTVVDDNIQEFVVLSPVLYSVTFIVDNGLEFVEGVEIDFDGMIEITDLVGEATFTDVAPGSYDYTISMNEYIVQAGTVDVVGDDVTIPITLILNGINPNFFNDVVVYPNPSTGNISIDNAENSLIQIIDQTGNIIYNSENENNHSTFDLTTRPAGIYNIILVSGKNISSRKVILVK